MRKAVFLDRDGVIIKQKHHLNKKEDLELILNSDKAMKLFNKENYLTIVVTNQPQIAKGLISEKEVIDINEEINKRFYEKGAIIDAFYLCPHHPKGTIQKYSINCECRKPNPGLLLRAAREYNINLNESYIVGDRISDIKAGNLAGCKKTIGVKTGYACDDGFNDAIPDILVKDVFEASKYIIKENKTKLFINTGGKGKRLYPLTKDLPKPMVKVKGKPILHHLVDWAKRYSINEIIMMNGEKANKIIQYFGNGDDFGISIKHSNEPFPLDSGGPLKYAKKHVEGTSIYISGDVICEVDLNKMLKFHKKKNADITVFLHESSHPHDSDILKINNYEEVIGFFSKHENKINAGNLGNAGLCILEPKIFDLMDKEIFNFENYMYPKILKEGLKMNGYATNERILDIGNPERLKMIEQSNFGEKWVK